MVSRKKQKFIAVLFAAMLTASTAISAGTVVSAAGTSSATALADVSKDSTSSNFNYDVLDDETICITMYKGSAADVVIPSTIDGKKVTEIGKKAFSINSSLTSVTIPNSVTKIGDYAFYCCTSLKSITIPNKVTTIGEDAFFNCTSLTSVTIPNSVTTIEDSAFYCCTSLKSITIPNSTTKIGRRALGYFYNDNYEYELISGFTIYAAKGSVAESYAKYNSITFKEMLTNISTISATTITKGSSIKLTAKATGGTSPYKYKYYCKPEGDKNWTALTGSTTSTTFTHKPARAIKYQYAVKIADTKNKTATKYFTVKVNNPLKNTSTISATTITKGNSIKLTAKATGGTAPYKYKYYCKPEGDKNWTALTGSTTSTTFTHKPEKAISYSYAVKIADASGKTATKYFKVNVSPAPLLDNDIQGVLKIVNEERQSNGLSKLTLDSSLNAAATKRAMEIVTTFEHTRPDGTDCFTVFDEYGIHCMAAGENIAAGATTPEQVMNLWMNSPGHKANILGDYTKIGVGVYEAPGTKYSKYWVQIFTK